METVKYDSHADCYVSQLYVKKLLSERNLKVALSQKSHFIEKRTIISLQ